MAMNFLFARLHLREFARIIYGKICKLACQIFMAMKIVNYKYCSYSATRHRNGECIGFNKTLALFCVSWLLKATFSVNKEQKLFVVTGYLLAHTTLKDLPAREIDWAMTRHIWLECIPLKKRRRDLHESEHCHGI